MLKLSLCNWGYLTVSLKKNSKSVKFFVHRLVAETFLENPNHLEIINHKDENKLNNRLDNLEWVTVKDNMLYSKRDNTKRVIQYDMKGNFLKIWDSITSAAEHYQVTSGNITFCLRGKHSSAVGYIWRYYTEDFPRHLDISTITPSKKFVY